MVKWTLNPSQWARRKRYPSRPRRWVDRRSLSFGRRTEWASCHRGRIWRVERSGPHRLDSW